MSRLHRPKLKLSFYCIAPNIYRASADDNFLESPITITFTQEGWKIHDDAKNLALPQETLTQAQKIAYAHALTQSRFQLARSQGLLDSYQPSRKNRKSDGMPRTPYSKRKNQKES